jgi:hypothetical protein
MGTMSDVILGLCLEPVYWDDLPKIKIQFNNQILFEGIVDQVTNFDWTLSTQENNRISIFFLNKKDSDTVENKDKAVIINSIDIEGFKFDSFMHKSLYRPNYSSGFYEYAKQHNLSCDPVIHSNYLGFNGEWWLDFTSPVFTWIYEAETQNLGWIYEKNI